MVCGSALLCTYSTPLLGLSNNGNQYRVVLTTLNAQSNSTPATLTVQADTVSPRISEIGGTAQVVRASDEVLK